jgi:diguanylate cyclase (GGDEF)-like protein
MANQPLYMQVLLLSALLVLLVLATSYVTYRVVLAHFAKNSGRIILHVDRRQNVVRAYGRLPEDWGIRLDIKPHKPGPTLVELVATISQILDPDRPSDYHWPSLKNTGCTRIPVMFGDELKGWIQIHGLNARLYEISDISNAQPADGYRDALTQLRNRRYLFNIVLPRWMNRLRKLATKKVGGLIIAADADGFKWVNDTYGHPTGDNLICAIGDRLSAALGPGIVVARTGGDEFVARGPYGTLEEARAFLDHLIVAMNEAPYEIINPDNNEKLVLGDVTVSLGAVWSQFSGSRISRSSDAVIEAWRTADKALVRAKKAGKARYVLLND